MVTKATIYQGKHSQYIVNSHFTKRQCNARSVVNSISRTARGTHVRRVQQRVVQQRQVRRHVQLHAGALQALAPRLVLLVAGRLRSAVGHVR